MLILHIIIAVSSLLYAAYVMLSPSKTKIYFSYGLIAGTFLSGTILIFNNLSHMIQACVVGLCYLAGVSIATIFAHRKLATDRKGA